MVVGMLPPASQQEMNCTLVVGALRFGRWLLIVGDWGLEMES